MKKIILINILITLVIIFVTGCNQSLYTNLTSLSSKKPAISYDAAIQGARPFVVSFYMNGCSACAKAEPVLKSVIPDYNGNVEFVVVYLADSPDICQKYGVRAYPTAFLVDPGSLKKIEIPNNQLFQKQTFINFIDQNWKDFASQLVNQSYREAQDHYSNGEYEQAINKYNVVLELHPDNSNVKQLIKNAQELLKEQK
ncbi:MAG: thioredoxin domain-containing protein [Cyanobacteriota bacterium]